MIQDDYNIDNKGIWNDLKQKIKLSNTFTHRTRSLRICLQGKKKVHWTVRRHQKHQEERKRRKGYQSHERLNRYTQTTQTRKHHTTTRLLRNAVWIHFSHRTRTRITLQYYWRWSLSRNNLNQKNSSTTHQSPTLHSFPSNHS